MSAFGGKADIAPAAQKCPLMTQSGHWGRKVLAFKPCMRHGPYWGTHATAPIHRITRRRGYVAASGACAAGADAGGWVHECEVR